LGFKRKAVTGDERRLYFESIVICVSHQVIWEIISRRVRWMGHVSGMGERRGAYTGLVGKPELKNHLENISIDGRLVLKWILKKRDGWCIEWNDLSQDRDRWQAFVNVDMNFWVP